MRRWLMILILLAFQASATVEDLGGTPGGQMQSVWPTAPAPSLPTYLPSACSASPGCLKVSVQLTGPPAEPDRVYTTQGKPQDYIVTVKNEGLSDVEAAVNVNPMSCPMEWFSWTSAAITLPSGVSRSQTLQVKPDPSAVAGEYRFSVEASARCSRSGSAEAVFVVQDYDYASETAVSGTGQFQINKDVRSMDSGIKSNKNVLFSGSVDALVKNEYLVDQAKGRNANFQEQDKVDNYNALVPGDALLGSESFRSSFVFGGLGAKVLESYNVQQMEFKDQDFNLHQTGSLRKMAEFKTADNFTGYLLIDAKQVIPGQKNLKEREEYLGSFEINRRILFRDMAPLNAPCLTGDCFKIGRSLSSAPVRGFASPCMSGSCNDFVTRLNAFTQPG
jgi:hypothetical protein